MAQAQIQITTKTCSKCGKEKGFSEFRKHKGKYGLASICRKCETTYTMKKRRERVEEGYCAACGKQPKREGKNLCEECSQKTLDSAKNQRREALKNGVCFRCGNTIVDTTCCPQCLEKTRIYDRNYRKSFCEKVAAYFNNACYICGLVSIEHEIFDCHHVDPTLKDFLVSKLWKKDWEIIVIPEMEKCIHVCSNCHRRLHHGYLDNKIASGKLKLVPGRNGLKKGD